MTDIPDKPIAGDAPGFGSKSLKVDERGHVSSRDPLEGRRVYLDEVDLRFCKFCGAWVVKTRTPEGRRVYLEPVAAGSGEFMLRLDEDHELTVAELTPGRGYYSQHDARCSDPVRFAGSTFPLTRRRPSS